MPSSAAEKFDPNAGELEIADLLPEAKGEGELSAEEIMAGLANAGQASLAETTGRVEETKATAAQIESLAGGDLAPADRSANLHLVTEAEELLVQESGEIETVVREAGGIAGRERAMPPATIVVAEGMRERTAFTMAKEMRQAGREVARLQAQIEKHGVTQELQAQLETAEYEYRTKRVEYVGDNVERLLATQERQIIARREFLQKEKGFGTKVYDAYKKLGELNLEKAGWRPTTRAGKILAKAASVRTAISLGLVGVSAVAGAGAAVGLAAIAGRRLLSGMGASIGTFDLLQGRHEAKLSAGFGAEEAETMSREAVVEQMEKIEANALVGGKSPLRNKGYQQLKARLSDILQAEQLRDRLAGGELPPDLTRSMQAAEVGVELTKMQAEKEKRKRQVAAGAVGVFVGSGAMSKVFGWLGHQGAKIGEWFGAKNVPALTPEVHAARPSLEPLQETTATAEPQPGMGVLDAEIKSEFRMTADGTVEVVKPPVEVAPPSEKMLEAGAVHKGDSYARVIQRDLMAEPEKFGYDPAHDGTPAAWAKKMSARIMHENGLSSGDREMRLRFDPASKVLLKVENGHIAVEKVGVKEYVFEKHASAPVAETPPPASPLQPGRFEAPPPSAPATIETPHIKVSAYAESTGGHVGGGHVGAPETELGAVVHEFKPATGDRIASVAANAENLGKGSLKNPELIKKILSDRTGQLDSLREAYEEAHRQGRKALEERLLSDYNAVARAANKQIGNVFKDLQPINGTVEAADVMVAKEAVKPAEALEPKPFVPVEKVVAGRELFALENGKLEFMHDKTGKLTGVKLTAADLNQKDLAAADGLLKDEALMVAREHSKMPEGLLDSTMKMKARELYAFKKVMAEAVKKDSLPSDQLKFLTKKIADLRATIVERYGEVLEKKA